MTIRSWFLSLPAILLGTAAAFGADVLRESARSLPVVCQVDVLVVGGSTGAVAAAVEAAGAGAKVFLAAPQPYLGDDMTATLRLWPQPGDELDSPLAQQVFHDPHEKVPAGGAAGPAGNAPAPADRLSIPRPMHVKKTLDEALLAAGVPFLYSCFPTDVLRDAAGHPAGVVVANRAGRQVVIAKTIIDATPRALVARLAGARFRPYPAGPATMKFVVIGGDISSAQGLVGRIAAPPFHGPYPNRAKTSSGDFQVIEYTVQVPMAGDTDAAWAAAEQFVRSRTYHPDQQFTADVLDQVPPDPMFAVRTDDGPWRGANEVPLDALRPADVSGFYVLGGCADVSRASAERLGCPGSLILLGQRVGKVASREAANRQIPSGVRLTGSQASPAVAEGSVCEFLDGPSPARRAQTVEQAERSLPVLARYDVVVVGGGTSGSPAAIASARRGARTLVVEQHHGLGGTGTLGAVTGYFFGYRQGFTATVPPGKWIIEQKMHRWLDELSKAGGEAWFGCIGCGALVRDGRVTGVVVATPRGRGVILAKAVVDTTGNVDIAAAAGTPCQYVDGPDFALMGSGIPPRNLGSTEAGTDFCIVDESDALDVWHLYVYAKAKYPTSFDQGRFIHSRERRRIVGDHTLTLVDEINERTYPDTIAVATSTYDLGPTQCYPIDPVLLAQAYPKQRLVNIPYRCCLPKGLDGIFVAAMGLSAEHDALPMVRMQADLQNLGYAVGVAAAMTARSGSPVRQIDLRALQQHLVEIGNVPQRVLTDHDSYPLPDAKITEAVRGLDEHFEGAAVLLAERERARPLLREAHARSEGPARLVYARMLGILGDPAGVSTLIDAVRGAARWDEGWQYRLVRGRPLLSPLDRLIMTLGRAGDRRAVPAIVEKMGLLTADDDFSHHRAVALALDSLADPGAARPLAQLLTQPGMSGHVQPTMEQALRLETPGSIFSSTQCRMESIRELILARALYHCGDCDGLGRRILEQYVQDLRGHLARHAKAVLEAGNPKDGTRPRP